ncbi:hypothetical protein SLEP1_g35392 [Rubroshorea leprosula]|uniref:Uncharacterized protein n=1 Tax=Rubroshorea leprosula TaxID=152421 RepID=A0AAV5KN12_9ROSI|nr:hypothetical protein SLEP1_g35392 [Rubroshorea leprosula]
MHSSNRNKGTYLRSLSEENNDLGGDHGEVFGLDLESLKILLKRGVFTGAMLRCLFVFAYKRVFVVEGVVNVGYGVIEQWALLLRNAWPKVSMVLKIFKEQGMILTILLGLSEFFSMAETSITTLWPLKIIILFILLQYDAFDIGFITTDDFTNVDILEATYAAVAKRLNDAWFSDPAIPVATGFLGKGWRSSVITTFGRGGSDLIATTIGKALGLQEIQVLHPPSMRPAMEGDIPVKVKNSYNPTAPGTLITRDGDMSECLLALFRKGILQCWTLSALAYLVCSIFEDLGISVDVVATSEVSISSTLDP